MRRMLITIYFDVEEDDIDEERDYDRFILEVESTNYRRKIFEIFDEKKYSWDDYKKFQIGYKPIMSIDQLDLTDLEIIKDNELVKERPYEDDLLEELELEA